MSAIQKEVNAVLLDIIYSFFHCHCNSASVFQLTSKRGEFAVFIVVDMVDCKYECMCREVDASVCHVLGKLQCVHVTKAEKSRLQPLNFDWPIAVDLKAKEMKKIYERATRAGEEEKRDRSEESATMRCVANQIGRIVGLRRVNSVSLRRMLDLLAIDSRFAENIKVLLSGGNAPFFFSLLGWKKNKRTSLAQVTGK